MVGRIHGTERCWWWTGCIVLSGALWAPLRRGTGGAGFVPCLPRDSSPRQVVFRWRDSRKARTVGPPKDDGRIAARWRPGEPA